jgi:hypothetical protein
MIECIFTIDYEIMGNGTGSLADLVYNPAQVLADTFQRHRLPFVAFIEAAELEMIERTGADKAIDLVKRQVRAFYSRGMEIGLHLHPQWYQAEFKNSRWKLDYNEYNLCLLPIEKIDLYLSRAISYLRYVLNNPSFNPVSFRAGNWLAQPSKNLSRSLVKHNIKIDSSVFKGGLIKYFNIDYRPALNNGYFWKFRDDINKPEVSGPLLEIPIYTKMVPFWKLLKRAGAKSYTTYHNLEETFISKFSRFSDFLRLKYPLKFDFCKLELKEMISIIEQLLKYDKQTPSIFKPVVLSGHTKDKFSPEQLDSFIIYLKNKNINITTLDQAALKCL